MEIRLVYFLRQIEDWVLGYLLKTLRLSRHQHLYLH
jgi:hypothetical protein